MLAKKFRFHGHHSLDNTYRRGKTVRSSLMSLRYLTSKSGEYRVAVVVSRKVNKSAVTRNKIRRRIYETIRLLDNEEKLPKNDMIITVFDDSVATQSPPLLKATITSLIEKTRKN